MLVSGKGILNASTIFPVANRMLVLEKCSVVLDPFSTEASDNFEWITATAQRTSGHIRFHTSVSSCNRSLWVSFYPTNSPKNLGCLDGTFCKLGFLVCQVIMMDIFAAIHGIAGCYVWWFMMIFFELRFFAAKSKVSPGGLVSNR